MRDVGRQLAILGCYPALDVMRAERISAATLRILSFIRTAECATRGGRWEV